MDFVCRIGTPGGEVVEQSFTAPTEAALRSELEQKGLYVFSVRRTLSLGTLGARRVGTDTLIVFGQELAALLKAGLPLLQCLDVMLERQRHAVFRASLATVRDKVRTGVALSEAFREEGDLYPPIVAATLIAGERSGAMETVVRRLVTYLRLTQSLRKKAMSASIYPLMLLVMMLGLVVVMMVKVIPQFQGFYEGMNVKLPLLTRVIIAVADVMQANFWWGTLAVAGGVVLLSRVLQRDAGRLAFDRVLLRVPYFGWLMRTYATGQLCRTLSTLLGGGLPLLTAMEVAASSVGNRAMAAAVAEAVPRIREGQSLSLALEATHTLEPVALEMIRVGEQTGALGDMLTAVADFYDEDLDTRMSTLLALVEPVMLVMMAILVGTMLLAFYLPLFEAISAVQRDF